jgi:hypothetical protein
MRIESRGGIFPFGRTKNKPILRLKSMLRIEQRKRFEVGKYKYR